MRKMLILLLLCLIPSIAFSGCSLLKKEVVVNVIDGKDYKELKNGEVVEYVCFTPATFQELAKARLSKLWHQISGVN